MAKLVAVPPRAEATTKHRGHPADNDGDDHNDHRHGDTAARAVMAVTSRREHHGRGNSENRGGQPGALERRDLADRGKYEEGRQHRGHENTDRRDFSCGSHVLRLSRARGSETWGGISRLLCSP